MTLVVDASIAVEFLLRTEVGLQAAAILATDELVAPELIDVEVLAVLRKQVRTRTISPIRARQALDDLRDWDLERLPHRLLLDTAWRYRDRVSAYDAFYVAAAHLVAGAVITADGPLSRAPGLGIVVHNSRAP